MVAVLRAEQAWVETFTGLWVTQFAGLLKVVPEPGGNGTPQGRSWSLPLAERALIIALYYRTNLTRRQLAPLLGASSQAHDRPKRRVSHRPFRQ